MAEDNLSDSEIYELEEAAKQASIYHDDIKQFKRNTKLSDVVHMTFHIFQFLFPAVILIFHLIDHFINHKAREMDPDIPKVLEMWNPLFFIVYPGCMAMSLVLAICKIFFNVLDSKHEVVIISSILGCSMMLTGGLSAMRHTVLHIDLNNVSDSQLKVHPVYVHNIIICLLSIFGVLAYLIHGWIVFDCWRWKRQQRLNAIEAASLNTISGESLTGNVKKEVGKSNERERNRIGELKNEYGTKEKPGQLNPIAMLESVPTRTPTQSMKLEDEPVILYCCCVDFYNYTRIKYFVRKPTHEFQIIHVM